MISNFYTSIYQVYSWWFGSSLVSDPFISGCLQMFTFGLCFVILASMFIIPFRWIFKKIMRWIRE